MLARRCLARASSAAITSDMTEQLLPIGPADIDAAARVIAPFAVRTPLLSFPVLNERVGAKVFLKPEMLQRTGSFKFRGAFNKVASIPQDKRAGGGLIAGVATAVKARYPLAEIVVAEPEAFDDHGLSLTAGHREPHAPAGRTICDALMALIPGEMTFAINSKLLARGVTASDKEVGAAVAFAYRELKLVVEPGGAVGLAALLAGRLDVAGKNVVIVLSGGNVDADLFAELVA